MEEWFTNHWMCSLVTRIFFFFNVFGDSYFNCQLMPSFPSFISSFQRSITTMPLKMWSCPCRLETRFTSWRCMRVSLDGLVPDMEQGPNSRSYLFIRHLEQISTCFYFWSDASKNPGSAQGIQFWTVGDFKTASWVHEHRHAQTPESKYVTLGNSLALQWLRLRTSTAGGMGSIPGWGTKILHAAPCGQKNQNQNM